MLVRVKCGFNVAIKIILFKAVITATKEVGGSLEPRGSRSAWGT
jgi:hypothetical protein